VTGYPGLYFVGLPWLHNAKSGLLFGVSEDAAHVASHIVSQQPKPIPERQPELVWEL
jgi:putative flavoprotein involved in K+ transport